MKVRLLFGDRDFDLEQPLAYNESALTQDLALDTILNNMSDGDDLLLNVGRVVLLSGVKNDIDVILYRQQALKDSLKNSDVIRKMYALAVEAMEGTKKYWWGISSGYPDSLIFASRELLTMLLHKLRQLRNISKKHIEQFGSEAFRRLFAMLDKELSDQYLMEVKSHLAELNFNQGVMLSAELAEGNSGRNYILRQSPLTKLNWLKRIFGRGIRSYTFKLDPRDETGARILSNMRDLGISRAAVALAQSADHIQSFFNMLRTELAFYVGCLNLYDKLSCNGPLCLPIPVPAGHRRHRFRGLYDASLSLIMCKPVVGNDADAETKNIVIITGANQGGKSVFLRSIGLAQIMMQCGMFVAAEAFEAELCTGLFTHYKREEDLSLQGGRLDEELSRMSEMADNIAPNAMLLCNESFTATNEREGSEIANQIVSALLDKHIKVFFVTHLYEFAYGMYDKRAQDALFLRAERLPDGTRTYRLVEGRPLKTSFGEDLYRQIFSQEAAMDAHKA